MKQDFFSNTQSQNNFLTNLFHLTNARNKSNFKMETRRTIFILFILKCILRKDKNIFMRLYCIFDLLLKKFFPGYPGLILKFKDIFSNSRT